MTLQHNDDHTAGASVAGGIGAIAGEKFDVMTAVGGVRGIVESVAPTFAFLVLFIILGDFGTPALIALLICVLFVGGRLIQKIPVTPALSGLAAMLISVVLAWKTGQASHIFVWGILTNAAYFFVLLVSLVVRWPLFGVVISLIMGHDQEWRNDRARCGLRRAYTTVTWLWLGLFAIRLAVTIPLFYLDQTEALGIAKIVLGLPLFALFAWYSWAYLKPFLDSEKARRASLGK
ncbi:hypothetical protein JOD55_001321 [Arcanobacterium pluranimalium]|uniref:DUF3159 domain-containing protein n=1 Tax=Arcanobacterium pluranimalium TaxID=108028 RepID=UPI00195D6B39|nr:hypothetical protein [Arcanobacterium pluranimalium]